jgi:branched-chain amino acid transport system permease protein
MAGETSEAPADGEFEERSMSDIMDPRGYGWPTKLGLVGILLLAVMPVLRGYGFMGIVVNSQLLTNLTGAMFFAVFAMSWDVQSGYTGEISFGHGLFFGVGGYGSAILNQQLGLDPMITIPLGAIAAAFAGLLIGFPSLRLQGPYFSLITLVTPLILFSLFKFVPDITGGATGLFADALTTNAVSGYILALGLFLLTLGLFLAITRSDAGIVLTAIREDELAVEAAGLNPAKFKLFAFIVSGIIGGLAGALYVHTFAGGFASASDLLLLVVSIEVIVASILGGIGTIVGAAFGGLFLFLFRIYLNQVPLTVPVIDVPIGELSLLLFFGVTLIFLFYIPEGVVPRVLASAKRRAATEREDGEGGPGGGEDPEVAADGGRPIGRDADSDDVGWTDGEPTNLERIVAKFSRELQEVVPGDGGDER